MADHDNRYESNGSDRINYSPQNGLDDRYSRNKHKYPEDLEMSKTRDREHRREQDREKEHDHYRLYEDRSARDERRRDRYDDRYRSNDYDRHRDRERRYKGRPRSHSRERSKKQGRSRSASPSHLRSKRTSGFDMAPPGATALPSVSVQLPGVPQAMPSSIQNMFPVGTGYLGALSLMPAQAMAQQATRHARRVYVGGLPPTANEQTIATFFSQVMAAIGGNSAGPGDAVVNVYINHEKKFAFVEMRSVEEASNAMALDGIMFEGVSVRVRRPTDYNPALAAALGPSQPSPHLNLAAIGLMPGAIAGAEGPDRVFVGGIPYYFTEVQMRELLESFGPLKGFDLVKDRDTGNSKGYGFCVYQDPTITDIACEALNGLKMGDKTLTVRRATISNMQAKSEPDSILVQAQQHIIMQKMALQAGGVNLLGVAMPSSVTADNPTKILCLTEVVTIEDLMDDNEYEEILDDMREECGKFGALVNVLIPRPHADGERIPGVGKVFLEYADIAGCMNAKNMLGGRKFGGNTVTAAYYPEHKYYSANYSG
ncbi:hypothetical protein Nepgr_007277 [Nepenthes gracilis]|uniref:Splicing factor U2af large subunit n=1 Tax=Nepenthes gracilis TaxID=150966 RepID=A0AAD3S6J5_NEPGR|nr:hypothetical protein Nepgr_007277 [Nepenthes gracilis]